MRILVPVLLVLFMGILVVPAIAQIRSGVPGMSGPGIDPNATDDDTASNADADEEDTTDCENGEDEDGSCKCAEGETKNENGECEPQGCRIDDVLVANQGYTGTTQDIREEQSDIVRDTQGPSCACHYWVFTNADRGTDFWPEYCPTGDESEEEEGVAEESPGTDGDTEGPLTREDLERITDEEIRKILEEREKSLTEPVKGDPWGDGLTGDETNWDDPFAVEQPTDQFSLDDNGSLLDQYTDGEAPTIYAYQAMSEEEKALTYENLTPEQRQYLIDQGITLPPPDDGLGGTAQAPRTSLLPQQKPTAEELAARPEPTVTWETVDPLFSDFYKDPYTGTLTEFEFLPEDEQTRLAQERMKSMTFEEGTQFMSDFNALRAGDDPLVKDGQYDEIGGIFVQKPGEEGYWDGVDIGIGGGYTKMDSGACSNLPPGSSCTAIHSHPPDGLTSSPPSFGDLLWDYTADEVFETDETGVTFNNYVWTEHGFYSFDADQDSFVMDLGYRIHTLREQTGNQDILTEQLHADLFKKWPERTDDINKYFRVQDGYYANTTQETRDVLSAEYEGMADVRLLSFDTIRNAVDGITDSELYDRMAKYLSGLLTQ